MATITIDIRERDLIVEIAKTDNDIITASLEVGDIKVSSGENVLLFERKTFADLASSIKDGRFREQKQRILSAYNPNRVTYIIEGAPSFSELKKSTEPIHGLLPSAFMSALMSLQLRDGFHLFQTVNVADTAVYILEVASRLSNSPEKVCPVAAADGTVTDYVDCLKTKTKKSANITPEVCYILQLCQIPGVSAKIAKDIAAKFPSMTVLLQAIATDGTTAFKSIAGIAVKKAAKLVEYCGVPQSQ